MKTLAKLLYVEADEEITDLVDRLRDLSLEDAVTFVVPERSRALQSPMSFRLLKRYADSYGKHVNVISGDARLQALSLETGFSAYPSLVAYDSGAEVHRPGAIEAETAAPIAAAGPVAAPSRRREAPVVSGPPKRPAPVAVEASPPSFRNYRPYLISAGVIGILALLALLLYVPTATATLSVRGTPVATEVQLIGAPGTAFGSTDHFTTQAVHSSQSQTVQGTATGQKQVAAVAATGKVTFTLSCFLCTENLPKGLVVRTDGGKRYATTQKASMTGPFGTTSVPVSAVTAGADGNTDGHTITTIEGNTDPDNLKVDNPQATTNGADARTATLVQQSDIDSVGAAFSKDTLPKVQADLTAKAAGLHMVPVGNGVQTTVAADHKVGDELQSPFNFSVTVTVAGDAVAFDEKAVKALLQGAIVHKIPPGSQLTNNPKLTYDPVNPTSDGNITLNGHAVGTYTPVFIESNIRSQLKGKTPSSAHAFLQSLPNVVDARVTQAPFGLPWLPLFSSRITLKIQEASGSPSP
ncbi:MAG: baseplate J/gp47 family protein [Candidatus Dormibacteraeota bacterium]|nr:baseplate J/gp47 family protein [Candidatus Dormibacteraeota bacterium]